MHLGDRLNAFRGENERCNATANIASLIHIVSLIRACTNLEPKGEIITFLDRDIRFPYD